MNVAFKKLKIVKFWCKKNDLFKKSWKNFKRDEAFKP
jgi:hypothetical protein